MKNIKSQQINRKHKEDSYGDIRTEKQTKKIGGWAQQQNGGDRRKNY